MPTTLPAPAFLADCQCGRCRKSIILWPCGRYQAQSHWRSISMALLFMPEFAPRGSAFGDKCRPAVSTPINFTDSVNSSRECRLAGATSFRSQI